MKHLLLVTLISSLTLFTACSKPVTEVKKGESTQQTQLSTNNKAHIQADIEKIQTFGMSQEEKVAPLEARMDQAMQNQDNDALAGLFDEFEAYIKQSNNELRALAFQSSEVNQLREKMIESSFLGLEMSKTLVTVDPELTSPEAIQQLQSKAMQVQTELMAISEDIRQKMQDQPVALSIPEEAAQ